MCLEAQVPGWVCVLQPGCVSVKSYQPDVWPAPAAPLSDGNTRDHQVVLLYPHISPSLCLRGPGGLTEGPCQYTTSSLSPLPLRPFASGPCFLQRETPAAT